MEAAARFGQRPTVLIGCDFSADWTDIDRLLAQALVLIERSLCGGCGQSLLRSTEDDATGHMEVREMWCEGCLQLDRDQSTQPDKPPAGRKPYLVDTGNW